MNEGDRIRTKYPNRIPIIIDSKKVKINRKKYLCPKDLTIGQFMMTLRKHIEEMDESQALFILTKSNLLVSPQQTVEDLDKQEAKAPDGMLHLNLNIESTFGIKKLVLF